MKSTYSRRYRRSSSSSREARMFKKDSLQEQPFFAGSSHESFFKPNAAIQRKCAHCQADDKQVNRTAETNEEEKIYKMNDKEEEKKIPKVEEKKEDTQVHRMSGSQEEEKKIHKMDDKKEEDKSLHRAAEVKDDDKKIQKMEEKKEEKTVHRDAEKKEEEKSIAKKENTNSGSDAPITSSYIHSLSGKGSGLPSDTLHFFSDRMGYDFSEVKIHTGTDAEKSAKEVNAKAYTVDNNIVFNKGQYNPASSDGKKLLAHELTHVVQQRGNEPEVLNRVAQIQDKKHEEEKPVEIEGTASKTHHKTGHGCADVNVQGQTDANYKSSFSTTGRSRVSDECPDCSAPDCITLNGTVVSVFKAHPVITLPAVPDGLSTCETRAVRRFINTTLKHHEQQHVSAFNTYNGIVRTPFSFTGCKEALKAFVQSIHDNIDAQRVTSANTLSDALDPFNVTIPCDCE